MHGTSKSICVLLFVVLMMLALSGLHIVHKWVDATCTEPKSCLKCEKTEGEPLGHIEGNWIVDVEPTCTEPGSRHKSCDRCGETLATEQIETVDHSFGEWVVNTEATCTEDGSHHRECSSCGYVETETIEATGHSKDASIICSVCGEYKLNMNEIGKPYTDSNGLTVTVNSFTKAEAAGYTSYTVNYTLRNQVPDSKLTEGSFKLFFEGNSGEPQYGGFNYMYYGDVISKSYTWKVLNSQKVLVLEYNSDAASGLSGSFFRNTPKEDALHWVVQ